MCWTQRTCSSGLPLIGWLRSVVRALSRAGPEPIETCLLKGRARGLPTRRVCVLGQARTRRGPGGDGPYDPGVGGGRRSGRGLPDRRSSSNVQRAEMTCGTRLYASSRFASW